MKSSLRGYRMGSPAERGSFVMLSAFAASIGASRGINYVREQRRPTPWLRSLGRRTYHSPGQESLRVHHFVPGIGLAFTAGAAAILTRGDGREVWLSLPFGVGSGLTLDEIALLTELDDPYWNSETFALVQGGVAALAAAGLAARFSRKGKEALFDEPAASQHSAER